MNSRLIEIGVFSDEWKSYMAYVTDTIAKGVPLEPQASFSLESRKEKVRQRLAAMDAENRWVPLWSTPSTLRSWEHYSLRRFAIVRAMVLDEDTRVATIGRRFDVCGGRISQIVYKLLRGWRGLHQYGNLIKFKGRNLRHLNLHLLDLERVGDEGEDCFVVIENLTFAQACIKADGWLRQFGTTLHVPIDEVEPPKSKAIGPTIKDAIRETFLVEETAAQRAHFYAACFASGLSIAVVRAHAKVRITSIASDLQEALPHWRASVKSKGYCYLIARPWPAWDNANRHDYLICRGTKVLKHYYAPDRAIFRLKQYYDEFKEPFDAYCNIVLD